MVGVGVVPWLPSYSFRGAAFARAFPIRIKFIFAFAFVFTFIHRPPKKAGMRGSGQGGVRHGAGNVRDDFGESRVGYPKIN